MKDEKIQVELKLLKVQETGFYMDSVLFSGIEKVEADNLKIEYGFKLDLNTGINILIIHLIVKYLYQTETELLKIIEIQTANSFELIDLNNLMVINGSELQDKNGIMPTILGVALGTLRGILVVKTAGTVLSDYPLPIVNPTELCKSMESGE